MCIRDRYQARLARLAPDSIHARLSRFLERHLAEDLSGERICREFGISRTTLYKLSRELFGCGISDHISRLRIQAAASLLTGGDLTNAEICRRVGIRDYNYFFRIFRKQMGMTPREYRRKYAQSALASPLASLPGEENSSQD